MASWLPAHGMAPWFNYIGQPSSFSARLDPSTVAPGGVTRVELVVSLEPGYHTYDIDQPDEPAVATVIELQVSEPLKAAGVWTGTPPITKFEVDLGKRINTHLGPARWWQEIEVPAGTPAGNCRHHA